MLKTDLKTKFIKNLKEFGDIHNKEFRSILAEVMTKTVMTPDNEYNIHNLVDVSMTSDVSSDVNVLRLEDACNFVRYCNFSSEDDTVAYHECILDAIGTIVENLQNGTYLLIGINEPYSYLLCTKDDICK